jgi:hypothetical protein
MISLFSDWSFQQIYVDRQNHMLQTHSTAYSPSWEANPFAVIQEIPRILWNPKVHYYIHKCPPPLSTLIQLNPVQPPHPTSWRPILILSLHLRLGLPSGLFPSGFLNKTLYMPVPSQSALHAPPISFFSIYHQQNVGWEYRSWSSSLWIFLQSLVTLFLLGPNILLNTLFVSIHRQNLVTI